MSIDSIITSLGGTSEVAKALGFKEPRVSNWRSRGRIPSEHWEEIVSVARGLGVNGITFETLAKLHAERANEPVGGEV